MCVCVCVEFQWPKGLEEPIVFMGPQGPSGPLGALRAPKNIFKLFTLRNRKRATVAKKTTILGPNRLRCFKIFKIGG